MSKTQTQSRTQTHADDRSRGPRKFEVWLINESTTQQPDREGGVGRFASAGEGARYLKVTTLSDLPQSRATHSGRDHESHAQYYEAPARESERSRKDGTGRHRTPSTNARPLDNGYPSTVPAPSWSRPRRSSTDNTERGYATEGPGPDDSRYMFHTQNLPDRTTRSDLEKKLSNCMKEKRDIADFLSQTVAKLQIASRRNEELEAQVQSLAEELETMKGQLQEAESRRRKIARLLHETAAELHGANHFLTKVDAMSEADVVNMVDILNAEIMQTSALIADELGELTRGKEPESIADAEKRDFNRRALGNALIQYLEREGQSIDPMSVQLALQFCLAETCYVVVESWRPGKWKGEEMLFEIYASMKRTGQFSAVQISNHTEPWIIVIQPVLGRWRALTRAQTNYQDNQVKVNAYFYRRVQDVLSLAGWPSHIPEHRNFLDRFKERIELLATLSLRLHEAISKDMTSGELRVKMVYPGERFKDESIDQAFPNETSNPNDTQSKSASGTTDLGLVRTVGAESRTLKKPKIVLESALHALLTGG
ncbi:hypothetical protein H2248_004282 [Termitomyces sp. 'cryptogamus']|nr:hypothetical protein H2248_004282 [Termitomyces sp. 'cryptogamus']